MKEDIIKMAREAGFNLEQGFLLRVTGIDEDLERFAALVAAAERNKLARWMIDRSYATGHGDTVEDLLKELELQVRESEREACAKVCEDDFGNGALNLAAAIRARGGHEIQKEARGHRGCAVFARREIHPRHHAVGR